MRNQIAEKTKFLQALEATSVVAAACARAGIPRSTIYRWLNDDVIFKKRYRRSLDIGNDILDDLAEGKLVQRIKEGYFPAISLYLQKRHPKYKDTKEKVELKKQYIIPPLPESMYDEIMVSKLPKQLRKQIVKHKMTVPSTVELIMQKAHELYFNETGINLNPLNLWKSADWGEILKKVLEEEPKTRRKP